MPNQTEVIYGGKSADGTKIVSLKDKLLNPALTSQYEVKIPVGAGNLNTILKEICTVNGRTTDFKHILLCGISSWIFYCNL